MRVAMWVGAILVVGGALVPLGYIVYYFLRNFLGSPDAPLPIQAAVVAIVVGVVVLLGVALVERLRKRRREQFGEVEY